jgi:hypothetical protein
VSGRRQRFPSLVAALAALLAAPDGAVARDTRAPASAAPRNSAVVLETFHAGQYDLDLAIEVRLLRQGRVADRVALPVPASSRRAEAESVDESWGADWGTGPDVKAWATGIEATYVSTLGRLVTFAPKTTGLLVSQYFGFEHVKRNHLVILPRNGKLTVAWKGGEGAGPTWSTTRVVGDPARERQDVVYFKGFYHPEENEFDSFDAARVSWDAASAAVRETPLPTPAMPLYLLNLGVHEDAAKARAARDANSSCLPTYEVLDAGSFPGLSGKAVLGRVYLQRSSADAAARTITECLPGAAASVLEWTAKP